MVLEFHPAADKYPLLEGEEYEALKESIRIAPGVRYPILTFQGKILDGRNRYRACLELGIEPKLKEFGGSEHEAQELVNDLNLYRRHLRPEQKREIIAVILKENPFQSNRSVAKIVGSNRNVVQQVREEIKDKEDTKPSTRCHEMTPEAEAQPDSQNQEPPATPEKRIGSDGKQYPAKLGVKAKLKQMVEIGKIGKGVYGNVSMWPKAQIKEFIKHVESGVPILEAQKLAEDSLVDPAANIVDQVGLPVPVGQKASFSARTKFEEIRGFLARVRSLVKDVAAIKGGEHLQHALKLDVHSKSFTHKFVELEQVIEIVRNCEPFASICPWCLNADEPPKGGCEACRHDGWVTESQWIRAGHDMQMMAMAKAQRKAERAAAASSPATNGRLAKSVVQKLEEEIKATNSERGLDKRSEYLESVKDEIGVTEYERLRAIIEAKRESLATVTAE